MRIVLLIPKLHPGAELTLNRLLKRKDLNILGIVRSDISPFKQNYWKYIRYGLRRAGLFYGMIIALTVYLNLIGVAIASIALWRRGRKWKTVNKLVKKHNLALHDTDNINQAKSINTLKSWKPDLVVSVSFDQILKKEIISIAKIATLNLHPGLLPRYKGLWPEFWKLHNREKFAGVTIHHINEKIDSGNIIAQIKFPIKKHDTKFSLALRSAQHGSNLLIKTLLKLQHGIHLPPLKLKGKPRYYSFPHKHHLEKFYAHGRKLFRFRDLSRHL